jgi:hypothetical protein
MNTRLREAITAVCKNLKAGLDVSPAEIDYLSQQLKKFTNFAHSVLDHALFMEFYNYVALFNQNNKARDVARAARTDGHAFLNPSNRDASSFSYPEISEFSKADKLSIFLQAACSLNKMFLVASFEDFLKNNSNLNTAYRNLALLFRLVPHMKWSEELITIMLYDLKVLYACVDGTSWDTTLPDHPSLKVDAPHESAIRIISTLQCLLKQAEHEAASVAADKLLRSHSLFKQKRDAALSKENCKIVQLRPGS